MAASLIRHLTSVEGNELEADLGSLVVRQSVWENHTIPEAEKSDNPRDKKRLVLGLLQAEEDFRSPPLIAEWLPLSNVLYPIVQQIILGDVEPQAGLDQAAEQVETLMVDAGY